MLAREITFEDYNGEMRTQKFHFNLNKAELLELEISTTGGLEQMVEKISAERDGAKIMALFKKIILMAYGEKDLDGVHFNKSPEISEAFSHTEAYSELFAELVTDADKAAEFIKGILPKENKAVPAPTK